MKKILIWSIITFGIIIAAFSFLYLRPFPLLPLLDSLRPISTSLPVQPKINLTFAKGMWLTSLLSSHGHSIADPAQLKEMGVNLVAFPVMYQVDKKGGEVKHFGETADRIDKQVISTIRKYKKAGLAILLTTQIRYLPKGQRGEPQGIPEVLQNDPKFFESFNSLVLHWADIAEKENVEFFAPTNEPEYMMGPWQGISWSKEILPEVRKRYRGKVIYKSGLVLPDQISWADFSGYDIAGTTIVVLDEYNEEQYREMTKTIVANLKETAQEKQKVPEIWVSGFGVVEMIKTPLNEKQKADIYQIIFEEAVGKVSGFIPWENPPNPLKGTLMEKVIREWFTEKIK